MAGKKPQMKDYSFHICILSISPYILLVSLHYGREILRIAEEKRYLFCKKEKWNKKTSFLPFLIYTLCYFLEEKML